MTGSRIVEQHSDLFSFGNHLAALCEFSQQHMVGQVPSQRQQVVGHIYSWVLLEGCDKA